MLWALITFVSAAEALLSPGAGMTAAVGLRNRAWIGWSNAVPHRPLACPRSPRQHFQPGGDAVAAAEVCRGDFVHLVLVASIRGLCRPHLPLVSNVVHQTISSILIVTMVIMSLTSWVMFTPFFDLHFQGQHLLLPDLLFFGLSFFCVCLVLRSDKHLREKLGVFCAEKRVQIQWAELQKRVE